MSEYVCDKCDGQRFFRSDHENSGSMSKRVKICPMCKGLGTYDWVERIIKPEYYTELIYKQDPLYGGLIDKLEKFFSKKIAGGFPSIDFPGEFVVYWYREEKEDGK